MGFLKAGISDTYLNVRFRIMRHVRRGWPCWLREEKLLWDYFHSVKKAQRAVLTGSFHDTQDGCRANRCTSPGDGKQAQRSSFPEVFSFRACPVAFSPGVYVQLSVLSAISFFFFPLLFWNRLTFGLSVSSRPGTGKSPLWTTGNYVNIWSRTCTSDLGNPSVALYSDVDHVKDFTFLGARMSCIINRLQSFMDNGLLCDLDQYPQKKIKMHVT